MEEENLRRLFPRASDEFIRSNTSFGGQIQNPKPKPHKATALDPAVQGKAQGAHRVVVRFTGYRVRPLDPDNFAGSVKDLLDGIRHAHLIQGDEAWRIKLETEQEKVSSFKEERTEIQITWP